MCVSLYTCIHIYVVIRAKIPTYVGVSGIIVQDLENSFRLCTENNTLRRMYVYICVYVHRYIYLYVYICIYMCVHT